MAWQNLGTANLINGSDTYGYCYFEYDDSSSEPRSVRLRIGARSGYSFYVNFNNVYVDGNNVGSWSNLTESSGVFWTGTVSGGRNVTASWTNPWYAGTQYPSITGYLPAAYTNPSGLSVSINSSSVTSNSATFTVSLSSYGVPSSTSGRYIEAAILGSSSYGSPYRFAISKDTNSATITVSNSSSGSLSIQGNTTYHYGAYANNTQRSISTVAGTFTTMPCAPIINAVDQGHGVIDFTITHDSEGSALTVTEEYSTDGGTTWTAITNSAFSLTLSAQTEVMVRRSTTVGAQTETVTVAPEFIMGVYASVSGQTKKVKKIYASISGRTKKVKKIYGSVNGQTKLVYEDAS